MVELKRWVAKEATDNGQVVEDSSLTDQAIFERLEQDVAFPLRGYASSATLRLLDADANPESDFAKQEIGVKERARRLVQIESQEDTNRCGHRKTIGRRTHGNLRSASRRRLSSAVLCRPPPKMHALRRYVFTGDEPASSARATTITEPVAHSAGGRITASHRSAGWSKRNWFRAELRTDSGFG